MAAVADAGLARRYAGYGFGLAPFHSFGVGLPRPGAVLAAGSDRDTESLVA